MFLAGSGPMLLCPCWNLAWFAREFVCTTCSWLHDAFNSSPNTESLHYLLWSVLNPVITAPAGLALMHHTLKAAETDVDDLHARSVTFGTPASAWRAACLLLCPVAPMLIWVETKLWSGCSSKHWRKWSLTLTCIRVLFWIYKRLVWHTSISWN